MTGFKNHLAPSLAIAGIRRCVTIRLTCRSKSTANRLPTNPPNSNATSSTLNLPKSPNQLSLPWKLLSIWLLIFSISYLTSPSTKAPFTPLVATLMCLALAAPSWAARRSLETVWVAERATSLSERITLEMCVRARVATCLAVESCGEPLLDKV